MKNSTFGSSLSTNTQLHNKISQQDEYGSYLGRVREIVGKKPKLDDSPRMYMTYLHQWKDSSYDYRKSRLLNKLRIENQVLLGKIVRSKERKFKQPGKSYHLAMHEKRQREMQRINSQNKRIATKITQQQSVLTRYKLIKQDEYSPKRDPRKVTHLGWNFSPLKERQLPALGPFYRQPQNIS